MLPLVASKQQGDDLISLGNVLSKVLGTVKSHTGHAIDVILG